MKKKKDEKFSPLFLVVFLSKQESILQWKRKVNRNNCLFLFLNTQAKISTLGGKGSKKMFQDDYDNDQEFFGEL